MIKEQGNFVREYSEGHGYGRDYSRRDSTRGIAIGGLVTGIVGTVAGVSALWNRNRGGGFASILGGSSGGGSLPANVNINALGGSGGGCAAPTPFEVYSKTCGDVLALTKAFYDERIHSMNEATQSREVDVAEKFQLWKSQIEADFGLYKDNRDNIDRVSNRINDELFSLYKYTRDKDDATNKELSDLKAEVAKNAAIRPYQDRLLQCEMEKLYTAAINYIDRQMCRVPKGVVVLPNTEVTGFGCGCNNGSNTQAGAA